MTTARGKFKVTDWNESTYAELRPGKLTRADVTAASLLGDLVGRARVSWLMCYRADDTADYAGFLDVDATLGGRSGGFVVQTSGTFDGTRAAGPWTLVIGRGAASSRASGDRAPSIRPAAGLPPTR